MRASDSRAAARQHFDFVADVWDSQQGPASARSAEFAARIEYLHALCRELDRPSVLDLGCGTGQTLLHLLEVIGFGLGIDISRAMIARARRNAAGTPLQFRVGDAAHFCMHCPDRFELVLLIGVLEHLPDQPAALAAARRVLTRDGRLVIIAPHPWNPAFRLKRLIDGGRDVAPTAHASPLSLRRVASRYGLEAVATRALPYTAWSEFNAAPAGCRRAENGAPCSNLLVGLLRGAFAAEFRRCDRY